MVLLAGSLQNTETDADIINSVAIPLLSLIPSCPSTETSYKNRILPPFQYQGGKSRLLKQLLPLLPTSFNNEPFVGGGAVCFSKLPSGANISDLDPIVAGVHQDVKDNFEDFVFYLGVFGNLFMEMDENDLAFEVIDI